jgi:hypothetical protein
MIENDKVIILQGVEEMSKFILNRALDAGDKYVAEFQEEYLLGHVVGYLNDKVVVFDLDWDKREERRKQREQEYKDRHA